MELNQVAVESAAWLQHPEAGEPQWWDRLASAGAPLRERLPDGRVCVTFLWRDPAGGPAASSIVRVYADVNSVTDHHSPQPQSLSRLGDTDVWWWQTELPADWRGSYAYIPAAAGHTPPVPGDDARESRLRHREWWLSIMALAISDPLNPAAGYRSSWGASLSPLHLPDAPDQSAWTAWDKTGQGADPRRLTEIRWDSAMLGKARRVWIYHTGAASVGQWAERPLAILLDGQHWAQRLPVFAALDEDTRRGRLPPAVYLLVDSIDGKHREEDLPCNAEFWLALQKELLPQAALIAPFSGRADCTVVAGQSYGGLAAMFAGLNWPDRFGCVLSQSGSFWWPSVELHEKARAASARRLPGSKGRLTEQLEAGETPPGRLRVFQEVGSREEVMVDVNDSHRAALEGAGHDVHYQIFEGGHDWLCWRGGLLQGLGCLWRPWVAP
ncbi:enterochelin esterase [Pseudogulbenkiania ferrooxidans]|uniref:Enterochelin esterase n=1 Tax=Pseudogulbenkiania ferrooxidans EGD-HP2 TaxID=1388764 RepID=A0ABP2XJI3_9NEIS|nr:enterochelin esterase [Pseudogulbenkiania ferrooxidans]ERE04397.1 enterochelin esterase [Pseudogulbenkiania ferrooxidans EGD-HP2]